MAILLLLGALVGVVFLFLRKRYQYWADRNVPFSRPTYILGNMKGTGSTRSFAETTRDLYFEAGDAKVYGMWKHLTPALIIKDVELVKHILVKDFQTFHDRGITVDTEVNPLTEHLFMLGGSRWKNMRTKLSPTFTSGKMKGMFPTFVTCADQLKTYLNQQTQSEQVIDIKNVASQFTVNIIGSCVFGIEINAFEDPNSKFIQMGDICLRPTGFLALKSLFLFSFPDLATKLKLDFMPEGVTEFFHGMIKDTMEYREKNNITRNDFLQLLLQLKNLGYIPDVDNPDNKPLDDEKFTTMKAAASAFIFFVAGFETSSSVIQYTLYELALHPEIQEKLREEIRRVLAKSKGEITYENIQEMEYLDRVISETLRKYPTAPTTFRQSNKTYHIPDTDIVLDAGTDVIIPLLGFHYDEKYFPKPEVFDPDRFLPENKAKREHFAYLPFGEGPRICIGMRFGLMQTKVGLITLLRDFKFDVCEKTQIPIKFELNSFLLLPQEAVQLKVSKC